MTESGNQQSSDPQDSANHPSAKPWGFWGTTGLGLVVALAFLFIQGFVSGFFVASIMQAQPDLAQEDLMKQLEGNGLAVAVATCATGVLCTALVLLLARIRRGISVREYLALRFPPLRSLLVWLGVGLVVAAASEGLLLLLGEESVPEFMISAYQTAVWLPLFWVALVVAAPLFEEIFFRGFLFQGWSQSKLREGGAIILTAALFSVMHVQYGAAQLFVVFVYGVVFGLARQRTGSLVPPLAMHGVMNLIATIQVALLV